MTKEIPEAVRKFFSEMGKKGGPARAQKLTAQRRLEIAIKASKAAKKARAKAKEEGK